MMSRQLVQKWALRTGKLLVLIVALGATYGLFAIGGLQVALRTREVAVPSLVGLTPEEAQLVLSDVGLAARVEPLRRVHRTIETGRVAEQDPSPGLTTRRRRSVKLWLSSGHTPRGRSRA